MRKSKRSRISRGALYTAAAALGVGVYGWFNGDPHPSRAADGNAIEDYVLYGIDPATAALVRYDFASGSSSTVGTIQGSSGGPMTGIEASAHFPGFSNIYGFWYDSSQELSKLVYIKPGTAQATVVGSDLGPEKITGACAVNPVGTTTYDVYALQDADVVPFNINEIVGKNTGTLTPSDPFAARVTVLGAAISYGGMYDIPVTVRVNIGGATIDPFGAASSPVGSNVNDGQSHSYVLPSVYPGLTQISVGAKSWIKTDTALDGSLNSHWVGDIAVDSSQNTYNVIALRDGDPVPQISGFLSQASVENFLDDFVDHTTNTIVLGENQIIYLFELGSQVLADPYGSSELTVIDSDIMTTDPLTTDGMTSEPMVMDDGSSTTMLEPTTTLDPSQDFQDLVVLVTLSTDTADLVTGQVVTGVIGGSMNINPNNSPHSIFELYKSGGGVITRDDLHNATASDVTDAGVYYSGGATSIRVKPKGNGSQNTLLVDGVVYRLKNNTTYIFTAPTMTVNVHNTQYPENGSLPMGHWWIDISTTGDLQDGDDTDDPSTVSQIVKVDHQNGGYTPVMQLSQPYSSIASLDGQVFYATAGKQVYMIDTAAGTETLLKDHLIGNFTGMGFAGSTLYSFGAVTDKLYSLNQANGSINGTGVSVGATDLGTIVLTPAASDIAAVSSFD